MKTRLLFNWSLLLSVVFLLSACSSVQITSIEKRRYQKGYHVQMKHQSAKAQISEERTIKAQEKIATSVKPTGQDKDINQDKNKAKKVKAALKNFKKKGDPQQLLSEFNDLFHKPLTDHKKGNEMHVPTHKEPQRSLDITNPVNGKSFGTGESAIVLVVVLVILLIIIMKEVIVAILIAILLALLILWLLRNLEIVD